MRWGFVIGVAMVVVACSSSDDTPAPSGGGVDASASSSGGSSSSSGSSSGGLSDASVTTDAGSDAGSCLLMGGNYDKTCAVISDCLMVSRGCYCGAQPIIGVSKSAQPAAQACESENEKKCALGCANAPGHVGEDGKNDEGTGKNLEVFCDNGQCKTRLEP